MKTKIYTPYEISQFAKTHKPHRRVIEAQEQGEREAKRRELITAIRESENLRYRTIGN